MKNTYNVFLKNLIKYIETYLSHVSNFPISIILFYIPIFFKYFNNFILLIIILRF